MYKHNNLILTTLLVFMLSFFGHADAYNDVYYDPLNLLGNTEDIDNILEIIELDEAITDESSLEAFMNSTQEELNSKPSKDDIKFMLEFNRIKSETSLNSTLVGELLPQIKELLRQSTSHLKSKLSGMTNGITNRITSLESALNDQEELLSNTSQEIRATLNEFTSETEIKLSEMTSEIRGISDRMTHTETVLKSLEEGIASKPSLGDIEALISKYHHHLNNSPAINNDANTDALKKLYCSRQSYQYLFEDSCYFFSDGGAFWEDAQDNCRQIGGHLVKITSSEEFHFIQNQITEDTWIGLNDIEEEGQFRWTDGTILASPQSWWYDDEPNNQDGNQNCVHFWFSGGANLWNDFNCNEDQLKFICEMPALAV